VVQERTLAYALKSSLVLLDPRPELAHMVRMVEQAFLLSEAASYVSGAVIPGAEQADTEVAEKRQVYEEDKGDLQRPEVVGSEAGQVTVWAFVWSGLAA
jgi:TPP-dependent indolepyruvate ferredoxin oxidoreductase alpha subunit